MGKRKHRKDQEEHIKRKIRRLEKKLRRPRRNSSSGTSEEYEEYRSARSQTPSEVLSDSDASSSLRIQSAVSIPSADDNGTRPTEQNVQKSTDLVEVSVVNEAPANGGDIAQPPSTSEAAAAAPALSADILEALGEAKGKLEVFGPKIQEEVSKRWGRILSEGLNKDQKKGIIDKLLVPENFTLVKAPKLNPEISAVLTESARNRDKRLEKAQQHLGLGIVGPTSTISTLIDSDMNKLELIKKLSEVNQILLDLHFENTINRRRLIIPTLDKKFLTIIQDVKRDSYLFGSELGEKIKASKTAEKSGLQIKKPEQRDNTQPKKYPTQQGNWKGPPRQAQRGGKQSGPRNRSNYQHPKKTWQHSSDRYQAPSKTTPKPTNKSQ